MATKEKKEDAAPKVFRKGKSTAAATGENIWVRVKDDESLAIVPLQELEDMVSIDQHEYWDINPALIFPCIGKGCPACAAGNKPKYKGFLGVMANGESEPKVFPFGISIERQIGEISDELGSIVGQLFKVKKTGKGLTTKYTIVATGKKVDVSAVEPIDVTKHINVLSADEIAEKIEIFADVDDEEPKPKKKAAKAEEVEEPETEKAGGWAEV